MKTLSKIRGGEGDIMVGPLIVAARTSGDIIVTTFATNLNIIDVATSEANQ